MNNLEHITRMGFNAIWISPIPINTAKGYHGYWAEDLYKVNPHFGTADELKALVRECHKRDIWVMLDVVANHMGNAHSDFRRFRPFNQSSDYHSYCLIQNYNNQREVEYCRIGDKHSSLPDLDTENPRVIRELGKWVRWVVREYDFDAIRIDTVKHVRKEFWHDFANAAGVYAIGEVLHGDPAYVGPYQYQMDGMLNFPLYFTLRDVFRYKQSMWNLEVRWEQNQQYFKDVSLLGNFIDNHDFARFLNGNRDASMARNALAYVLFSQGIPIVYQGTEYLFSGGDDPRNRESLWPELFTERPQLGSFFKKANLVRQIAGRDFYDSPHRPVWTQDDLHVFMREDVLVAVTNSKSGRFFTRTIKLPQRRKWINVLNPSGRDELQFKSLSEDKNMWVAELQIYEGEPKIFYPADKIRESGKWFEFFD